MVLILGDRVCHLYAKIREQSWYVWCRCTVASRKAQSCCRKANFDVGSAQLYYTGSIFRGVIKAKRRELYGINKHLTEIQLVFQNDRCLLNQSWSWISADFLALPTAFLIMNNGPADKTVCFKVQNNWYN